MPRKSKKQIEQENRLDLLDRYQEVINEVQSDWTNEEFLFLQQRNLQAGIRSSQVAALIFHLVRKGVL